MYNITMLFDLVHILYMVVTAILTIVLLVVFKKKVEKESTKDLIIKISAIVTVFLHYSPLLVGLITEGKVEFQDSMIMPIYPCNVIMWLLLITAFIKKKDSIGYRILAEFTFLAGLICGSIGIILNENYADNPNILDYDIFKGLFSHTTMVFGCVYLKVGGFVRISTFNILSCICGLLLFIVDGTVINSIFKLLNEETPNSMYLEEIPFADLPWLNTWVIGIIAVLLISIFTISYEQLFFEKENRWYSKLHNKISELKEKHA